MVMTSDNQNTHQVHYLLFIYTETPLHAGSGQGLGAVDLPIQRERVTDYPIVQSSSLKGRLRAQVRASDATKYQKAGADGETEDSEELFALFGKADGENKSFAGAIAPGDAHLLLFPVRSLQGVFAWVTSVDVLARFQRDMQAMGFPSMERSLPDEPEENECWAGQKVILKNEDRQDAVTLEEFTYAAKSNGGVVSEIGTWLAKNALPNAETVPEYQYWRDNLPDHLVILRREDFRDFARYGTEVRTHIRLQPDTKTVQTGALWTVESLPSDTLLYAPLIISNSRAEVSQRKNAVEIAQILREVLDNKRTHLGGDETTGQGMVMLHFCSPEEVKS
jgi:CRISPR-associated protein Cmr4